MSQESVTIPLAISPRSLAALRAEPDIMRTAAAPDIALVELDPAHRLFTLGGSALMKYAREHGGPLLPHQELYAAASQAPAPDDDANVGLLLGVRSFRALTVTRAQMDGPRPPLFGLVQFPHCWRLAGDLIAHYLESRGGRVIYSNNLDRRGRDITGENTYN